MDKEFSYSIEDDTLIRNDITPQDADNTYLIVKTPIITKDVFVECYRRWIKDAGVDNE